MSPVVSFTPESGFEPWSAIPSQYNRARQLHHMLYGGEHGPNDHIAKPPVNGEIRGYSTWQWAYDYNNAIWGGLQVDDADRNMYVIGYWSRQTAIVAGSLASLGITAPAAGAAWGWRVLYGAHCIYTADQAVAGVGGVVLQENVETLGTQGIRGLMGNPNSTTTIIVSEGYNFAWLPTVIYKAPSSFRSLGNWFRKPKTPSGGTSSIDDAANAGRELSDGDVLVLASVGETKIGPITTRGRNVIHNNNDANALSGIEDSLKLVGDQGKLVGIVDGQLTTIVGNRVQIPLESGSLSPGGVGFLTIAEWARVLKVGGELRVSIANADPDDVIRALRSVGFKDVRKMPNFSPPSSQWYSATR